MSGGEQVSMTPNKLHPRLLAEQNQARLEEIWPDLQEESEMWCLRMREHMADPDKLSELSNEAIQSLDSKWPFAYHCFLVAGKWREPDVTQTPNGVMWAFEAPDDVLDIAQSYGFSTFVDENSEPKIGLSFICGSTNVQTAVVSGGFYLTAFAEPSEISLTYVRPVDGTNQQMLDRTPAVLAHYDKLLELYVENENSGFFNANWRKQRQFFEKIIADANDVMTSPGMLMHMTFSTPYVYARNSSDAATLYQKFAASPEDEALIVSGYMEAATILELTKLDNLPLRSPADLIDAEAGICIILQLDDEYVEQFGATHLFVPTRSVFEMELEKSR